MTHILTTTAHKIHTLRLLRQLIDMHVTVGLKPTDAAQVYEHFRWMEGQKDHLHVNCQLETVPELQLTRLTLEYSFQPIPPKVRQ